MLHTLLFLGGANDSITLILPKKKQQPKNIQSTA